VTIINIPDNFVAERIYIIDVLFKEFLGLDYRINIRKGQDYEIKLENDKSIIIKDEFFSGLPESQDYLKCVKVPQKADFIKNRFTKESDIPVIFGNGELNIVGNKIICGIDIFASSFFMLTRWEEYVNRATDSHNRFPASESLAYKNNFLDRPIVNEYLEMLWSMLLYSGCNQQRIQRAPSTTITCDIDAPFEWLYFRDLLKTIAGNLLKRRNIFLALNNFKSFIKSRADLKNDPFNSFPYILDLADRLNIKSHLFFMAAKRTGFDAGYSLENKFVESLIKEICARGHIIGFHPSYHSYNNEELWRKEYEYLSQHLPYAPKCGRQHFLRFEIPQTWHIWDDAGMEWDSTLGYAEREGFRCGCCYEFSVFNIVSRKKLRLKERPLLCMDTTFSYYQELSPCVMEKKIMNLIDKTKNYNGNFVLLWHNSNFSSEFWKQRQYIYERIIRN